MTSSVKKLVNILSESKNIAIITHTNPDGDAFGSALAMYEFLTDNFPHSEKHIYTECAIISDEYKLMLQGVTINEDVIGFDTAIVLDCSDPTRFEKYIDIFNNCKNTINIDHHKSNTFFAKDNYVNIVSSNCENIYNILKDTNLVLGLQFAKFCYAGIISDTNNLTIPLVSANTHKVVSELIQLGVDTYKIRQELYGGNQLNRYKLLALSMAKAEFLLNNKVIYIVLTNKDYKKCNISDEETNGIINQAFSMKEALACFLISPRKGKKHISMRSKEGIDVSAIASKLGGGGHLCAAACNTNLSLKQIKKLIVTDISAKIKEYKTDSTNPFN